MTYSSPLSLLDRFRGCILGQAVGDGLAAPFETMPATAIYYAFGFADKIVAAPPVDELNYTDDTQMMIGIAEVLTEQGQIEGGELMRAFVTNFDATRAYGVGTHKVIDCAAAGGDWDHLSATLFPGGSLGNGAAMRVAPVGLFFHTDLNRVEHQAQVSATVTHKHPIGIDGARIMAIAVALVTREALFDRGIFYSTLIGYAQTAELRDALEKASKLTPDDTIGLLGTSVEAHRSVPAAIACFTSNPSSYARVVAQAISLGGDTDTIAAMAGALSGAHLGMDAIPVHLLNLLEDGPQGRRYLDMLARRLYAALDKQRSTAEP
jgi:poly(ADP-ribose) glycohydrolase ARH3